MSVPDAMMPTTGETYNGHPVPKLCPRCYRGLGQTDHCGVCREYREAMARADAAAATVMTPADRSGTLVDTGYRVGERLVYRTMRGPQTVVVLGPSPAPHEFLTWGGSGWERRFAFAPQLRVVREGEPETRWLDAPLRLLSRPIGDRIDAEIAATGLAAVTDQQIAATVAAVKARLAS